jgi:predicted transcriptional regulator
MENKKWTFLSNHGRVFNYLAKHPENTTQVIAQEVGLSIRAVQKIIDDLELDGYLHRQRVGRCNHYAVHPEMPMRHRMEAAYAVGTILLTHPDVSYKQYK